MKLLKIQIKKSTSANKVQNIKRTLQGVQTVGYINLMAKNKVQTYKSKGNVSIKVFKSKTALKVAKLAIMAKAKANEVKSRLFNQCWLQSAILEANINKAKLLLKRAKGQYLTTLDYFALHVNLCKAYLHLRSFKMSLPKAILNLLF